MDKDTSQLYDHNANRWERREPVSLSDFTGRPAIFSLCEPVTGLDVLDLGCGEGYCSRVMRERGAASVIGLDISENMVALARQQETQEPRGIRYEHASAEQLTFNDGSFHLVLGMFVYNYLTTTQMAQSFREVKRVLKPGGHFVFAVPHPAFAYIRRSNEAPFYFDTENSGYFSGRNRQFQGEIFRRDNCALPVQMIHKTFQDYMEGLAKAGFTSMPTIEELNVKDDHLALDEAFFQPVADTPLHLGIRVEA